MSRQDFIRIAGTIADLTLIQPTAVMSGVQRTMIAEEFADRLAATNPRFNRDLFIQAATGQVPLNARKSR